MEQLNAIGYYICKRVEAQDWIHGVGKRLLSVSGCIGEQHPRPECFLGGWRKGESRRYQEELRLSDRRYRQLLEAADRLFALGQIDVDSRFLSLSEACQFARQFCGELDCQVVSLSTWPEYMQPLAQELRNSGSLVPLSGQAVRDRPLGCDILGWDISGFHSFLCNALQRELPAAEWNEFGLLKNDFQQVVEFAKQIQGKGEPVQWIPCQVGGADGQTALDW